MYPLHPAKRVLVVTHTVIDLTQEEIAQMMGSSREKVSVALNRLRDRAMVQYSRGGHLRVDVIALESWHT